MKKIKMYAVILCAAVVFPQTAGCDSKDISSSSAVISETAENAITSIAENSESDIETSESKINGIDFTFNGNQISIPRLCKEYDFFEVDESSLCSSYGYCTGYIMNGNKIIGNIFFDSAEDDKDVSERTVIGFSFDKIGAYDISTDVSSVYFNGIGLNDKKEKVIELLGEPYSEKSNDYTMSYLIDENDTEKYYSFGIDINKGTVESISYFCK